MKYMINAIILAALVGLAGVSVAAGDVPLAKDAGERGTPPWTNDSANIHNDQPRTPPKEDLPTHHKGDFEVKDEWEQRFADHDHIAGDSGEAVFKHVCQACHMQEGRGAQGAGEYPKLAGDNMLAAAAYPIHVILHGRHGMTSFAGMLSDEQIADVVNYIRSDLNDYDSDVTADDIATARDSK